MSDFDFAASEQSPPRLLQIRIGQCLPPADYQEKLGPEGWPCDIPSAYFKHEVSEVEAALAGLKGNESGHPVHIEDAKFRAALVHNTVHNEYFKDLFPDHVFPARRFRRELHRGSSVSDSERGLCWGSVSDRLCYLQSEWSSLSLS